MHCLPIEAFHGTLVHDICCGVIGSILAATCSGIAADALPHKCGVSGPLTAEKPYQLYCVAAGKQRQPPLESAQVVLFYVHGEAQLQVWHCPYHADSHQQ
jgi:hypothetical protein